MSLGEIPRRLRDALIRRAWRHRRVTLYEEVAPRATVGHLSFVARLPPPDQVPLPQPAADELIAAAQALLRGEWRVFGQPHPGFGEEPDWFVDASSGRHAPSDSYAFDIGYRDAEQFGDNKFIWEPSRHNHLTMLAAAYAATKDEQFARRVATHLQSWWRQNPFLTGPHWTSGIELGLRLISWVWIRRLLDDWTGVNQLFEANPLFISQLYSHQRWLSAFSSRGSSANNHLLAETAGQFAAACAFPYFSESGKWRRRSAYRLGREILTQTFPSGLNREMATGYHRFVLEIALAGAIEGERGGHPLGPAVWERIRAMTDSLMATLDAAGCPPRQGDDDDGVALLLDAPDHDSWSGLAATGRALFGAMSWWPQAGATDVRTTIWTRGLNLPPLPANRPTTRQNLFDDAGQVFLRVGRGTNEIWCRCDHGPHGYLGIAAHAHADALALELRVGGVEILSDPGTYCYNCGAEWRAYFRSTIGHNTIEFMSQDQSISAGPFLWTHHAQSRLVMLDGLDEETPLALWSAEQSGYVGRGGPVHRRTVTLDRSERIVVICDEICGVPSSARQSFHLGPAVQCRLKRGVGELSWPGGGGELELSESLSWTLHLGQTDPPLGWYSASFGIKAPSFTLVGTGTVREGESIVSRLRILPGAKVVSTLMTADGSEHGATASAANTNRTRR